MASAQPPWEARLLGSAQRASMYPCQAQKACTVAIASSPYTVSAKQFSEPSMGSMGCPSILIHGQAAYLVLRVNDLLLPPRLLLPDLLLHPCQLSL